MRFSKFLSIFLLFVLVSCQSNPETGEEMLKPSNDNEQLENPKVIQYWQNAEKLREGGYIPSAQKQIKLALQILPNKAILWSRLAEFSMLQKQAINAEEYATKSNVYAGRNITILKRNWMIIKHSRLQRKDKIGASQADLRIQKLNF